MLQASVTTLAKIGGNLSIPFLYKIAGSKDSLAKTARVSAAIIEQRLDQKTISN